MRTAGRNRLREGQVVSGMFEIAPVPPNAGQPAERDAYDGVDGVFVYTTGEELLAEMDREQDGDNPRPDADKDAEAEVAPAPAAGKRRQSMWERMLETLDIEFSRPEPGPAPRSLAGEIENPTTDLNRSARQSPETSNASNIVSARRLGTDGTDGTDGASEATPGITSGGGRRGRAGLRATLGELFGVRKQSRHAR